MGIRGVGVSGDYHKTTFKNIRREKMLLFGPVLLLATLQSSGADKPRGNPPCGKRCRSTDKLKWVYCNQEWKRVTPDTCQAVFEDPALKICNENKAFFQNFPGADAYIWNPAGNPQFYHCNHLPTSCFCNACSAETPPPEVSSTTTTTTTTAAPSSCKCGIRNKGNRGLRRKNQGQGRRKKGFRRCFEDKEGNSKCRIVGGSESINNEFPWQVGIKSSSGKHPFCGGSILSKRTILTAQHCTNGLAVSNMKVVVGDHDTQSADGEIEFRVERKLEHPDFDWATLANDFAILYLSEDLVFDDTVSPVCLPADESDAAYNDVVATVPGWGTTYEDGPVAQLLQKVDVDTMTNAACNAAYGEGEIQDNMICAARQGKDACQGDSGGPMVFKETGSAEEYYSLIGVVSWGAGCADPSFPGVYGRVTNQIKWIKDNMEGDTCQAP